jgi:hypothetical protein
MKSACFNASTLMMICVCILICCQLQALDEKTQEGEWRTKAGYEGTGKILVPHTSWPCGMADGIPVPELGVPVLEANMKLDQAYEVGKTPYGQRTVFVIQGGAVLGEKITGLVMPGGLDFQLQFSNGGMEIEEIFTLRTSEGKYIYLRSAGTAADQSDIRMVPDFEAPNASSYSWLNSGKYAGRRVLDLAAKTMKISVYEVSGVASKRDAANSIKATRPKISEFKACAGNIAIS